MIAVTAIETGMARLKAAQKAGRDGRGPLGRKLDIMRDGSWVGPLPIYAFLIRHPDGFIVVDTGETWRTAVPGYLPRWHPFYARDIVVAVAPHEEIGPRLLALGVDPARDVGTVVLTHMHHDHTGGLHHFPRSRIVVSADNYAAARGPRGLMFGCLPHRWPRWFRPDPVRLDGPPLGPFPASYPLTRDGRVALVPTPGHMRGHLSVVVRAEDVTYLIAGDVAYDTDNLAAERVDGVCDDPGAALASVRAVKAFAAAEPTVVLPAHDPGVPGRIAARHTFV